MKSKVFKNPRLLALFLLTASIDHAVALEQSFQESKVSLVGHVPQKALANASRVEDVDPDSEVSLLFTLPLRNQQALEELVQQMYDPNNKEYYRKYLTPDEFIERFAPTQEDYDQVVDYAKEQGFNVLELHPNRTILEVSGSAKSIQAAFNVTLDLYQKENGVAFYAPSNDPTINHEIASKIGGIVGLENATEQTPMVKHPSLQQNQAITESVSPSITYPSGPQGGFTPSDIKKAYNLTGVSEDGTGQKIAIFAPATYRLSDITTYANYFHLPTPRIVDVLIDGGGTFEAMEVALDIEMALALAPASEIYVYQGRNNSGSILKIYNRIATDNIAKQVSTSWGWPEHYPNISIINAENAIFLQMAAQGQTVYVASGDRGAYETGAAQGLEVQDPGSQPYVTGVGGTTLIVDPKTGNYVRETVWGYSSDGSGGGGGVSEIWPIPVWQQNLPTASSTTYRNTPDVALNSDPNTGYDICYQGVWYCVGGTSCAAPLWASFTALVNQRRQATLLPPLGFANPTFYNIGRFAATQRSSYHDITTGNNLFYSAVPGYDNATGWGSFNGQPLLGVLSDLITVSISSPTNNGSVAGNMNVSANATNSIGIGKVDFYIDSVLIGSDTTAPYSATYNTAGLTDGSHLLRAVAYNVVGSSAQSTSTVNVYNGKPTVSLISPVSGATVAGSVTIGANASDIVPIGRVDLYVDTTLVASDTTAPYQTSLNTMSLPDGTHVLKAVAYNNLGSFSEGTAAMNVYNGKPILTFQSPIPGATVANSVDFTAQALDAVPIDHVDLYVDDTLLASDIETPYQTSLNTTTLPDGTHVLKAVAYNNLGSFSEGTAAMNVYNGKPTLSFQSPIPGATVANSVDFMAQALDAVPIDHVDLYVDDTLLASDIAAPYQASLNTTTLADGTHVLKAVAYNNLGSFSEGTAAMNVYNGKPAVSVQSPLKGATVANKVDFIVKATDAVPIDHVDLYVDSTLLAKDTKSPYQTAINTTTLSNGSHLLKAVAYNNLGTFSEGTAAINVYNGKPQVALVSPVAGATLTGTTNLVANATDAVKINRVDFYVDSTLIATDKTAPYTAAFNTSGLSAGQHTIKAVAYNELGNSSQAETRVNLFNTLPLVQITSPQNGAVVTGSITIAAVVPNGASSVEETINPDGTITKKIVFTNTSLKKIEFYLDSKLVLTGLVSPYKISLNTSSLSKGTHTLKAVAYNYGGLSAESTITITVK